MPTLNDVLMKEGSRSKVIADSVILIDQEVGDKRGLSGVAIKAGYKVVKRMKKNFVEDALDGLIDLFIAELDPFYQEHGKDEGFGAYMVKHTSKVADGMLSVTDRRRDASNQAALRKAYDKLRPMAKTNVEAAMPRLSKLIQKHLDAAS